MKRAKSKILDLNELAAELELIRAGKTVSHCHGVFDLLHIGHIRYLEEAKSLGDILVVTLTEDHHVNKGPHRPAFTQTLRAEALAALACVDYVAINRWPNAVETIRMLRPDLYVKGAEYRNMTNDPTGKIVDEARAVEEHGGRIHFSNDIVFSSSRLINAYYSPFPPLVAEYLSGFAERHPQDEVLGWLKKTAELRPLALGEAIIDEHHYCETLGKSGKEPILAALFINSERAAGGILAIAGHLASFAPEVDMVTFLGAQESHEEFIRKKLPEGVNPNFLYLDNSPTIVKRRFVETYPLQKLFEIYIMNGFEEDATNSLRLRETLEDLLGRTDLVVVADYGHGMFDEEAIVWLADKAPFLAVNTQVNAGNLGFNTIYKYPKADFVSLSEKEIRMAARNRVRNLFSIVEEVAGRLGCPRMLITRGKQGCLAWGAEEGFFEVPAFTGHIVDRVGAGDAVLSVTSLLARLGAPMEVVGVLANVAGAQAVGTMSNHTTLDRTTMVKHLISLMK